MARWDGPHDVRAAIRKSRWADEPTGPETSQSGVQYHHPRRAAGPPEGLVGSYPASAGHRDRRIRSTSHRDDGNAANARQGPGDRLVTGRWISPQFGKLRPVPRSPRLRDSTPASSETSVLSEAERVRYTIDDTALTRQVGVEERHLGYDTAADRVFDATGDGESVLAVCNTIESSKKLTNQVTGRPGVVHLGKSSRPCCRSETSMHPTQA